MAEKKIVDLVVKDNLQETESHLKKLNEQIDNTNKDVKDLSNSFNKLDKSVTDVDASFEEVYGDLKPLTARMGEAEDRLYELALAGKQGTAEFKSLLKAVGNYRKTQIETDLAVDAAALTLVRKLGGALEYVSGLFAVTQGSLALFGKENKDVEKAILKVQSALAITQGFAAMREGVNSVKLLGASFKSLTVVQSVYNFVNNATSIGLKILRGALVATGIGALVVGVGMLIANFDKLKAFTLKLIPGLASVGKVAGGLYDRFTDLIGITNESTRAMERMLENADKSLKKNAKFLKENGSITDQYTKQKIEAVNEYNEALKEDGANQVALAKELNRKLAKIDKERSDADKAKQKEIKEKGDQQKEEDKRKLQEYRDSIRNATKAFNDEIEDLEATTEQARLDLWLKRKKAEIDLLAKNEKDKNTLLLALQKDYNIKQEALDYQLMLNNQKAREEGETAWAEYEQSQKDKLEKARQEGEEARVAYEKDIADKEQAIRDAKLAAQLAFVDASRNAIGALGALFEQGTDAAKVAALADIAIGTATGFIQGLDIAQKGAKATGPAAPFAFPIFYATQIAAVLGAASRAQSVLSSGSVSSASSAGTSSPATSFSAPSFNVVGTSGANQIAQTIGKDQPPIKAYVVSNDVTTQQAFDRNIVKSASLG